MLCLLIMMIGIFDISAEQLATLPKRTTDEFIEYISTQKIEQLAIYDACESPKKAKLIKIKNIYTESTGIRDLQRLYIETSEGENIKIDLAYLFAAEKDGKYYNVGRILGMYCYPCVEDGFTITNKGKVKGAIKLDDEL